MTHLHLVCFAYALLTNLRIERTHKANGHAIADLSTAAAQDQIRSQAVGGPDLLTYLQKECFDQPVIEATSRR